MARTEIKQTTVSGILPTPITLTAMDATSASTTLSAAASATITSLIVGSLSGLTVGDYLLVQGAERVLVTALPDGSSIASSTVNAGGSGYAVNDTGRVNGGNADALYVVDTVSSGAVATYHLTNTGTAYQSATGATTTTLTGSGTGFTLNTTAASGHTVNVTRGQAGTAAVSHPSSATVVDIGVGNTIASPTAQTVLLFYNSDSSSHTITIYGPTGSQSYTVPTLGYLLLGRITLATFVQSDGSMWMNADSATVYMAAVKVA